MAEPEAEPLAEARTDSDGVLLEALDVHVTYRLYQERRTRMRDLFARSPSAREHREIHAVRGISLSIGKGEALGVVGANGSGKSTLLGAMAGLIQVTSGSVRAVSQPSLLGVNAALRPALSGRRNIIIGGLALGLSKQEIGDSYDEIVAFAELEDFIDMRIGAYSSGMRARLHFAIATAVSPEILMIDEALAVGDRHFKAKSLGRIESLRAAAGAFVLVTHNLSEVVENCSRAIWIRDGTIECEGEPSEVVGEYQAFVG